MLQKNARNKDSTTSQGNGALNTHLSNHLHLSRRQSVRKRFKIKAARKKTKQEQAPLSGLNLVKERHHLYSCHSMTITQARQVFFFLLLFLQVRLLKPFLQKSASPLPLRNTYINDYVSNIYIYFMYIHSYNIY